MTTIARNATRKIAAIKAEYTECVSCSLDNDFTPSPVDASYAWEALARHARARLTECRGHYCIQIHSNLWYELRRPAAKPEAGGSGRGPRALASRLILSE
ncbi:hypothetical protein [Streptomyces abikoensis]